MVVEADAVAWRWEWRRGELFDEVVHSALELREVAFRGIHAALQAADALDFVQPVQEHLPENSGCPAAKPNAFRRFHPIANRNHHIEIVHQFWSVTTNLNIVQFLHINALKKFALPYRIVDSVRLTSIPSNHRRQNCR